MKLTVLELSFAIIYSLALSGTLSARPAVVPFGQPKVGGNSCLLPGQTIKPAHPAGNNCRPHRTGGPSMPHFPPPGFVSPQASCPPPSRTPCVRPARPRPICPPQVVVPVVPARPNCNRPRYNYNPGIYIVPDPRYPIAIPVPPPRPKWMYEGEYKPPQEITLDGRQRDYVWDQVAEDWIETGDTVTGTYTTYWWLEFLRPSAWKGKGYLFQTEDGKLHWYWH